MGQAHIGTMRDLFIHHLEDIYYAEERILETLPKMMAKANSSELRQGFKLQLADAEDQVKRLERVFQIQGLEPQPANCLAIDGIIAEGDELLCSITDKKLLDPALLAAAQAAKHYEMIRYGALVAWAKQLDRDDCARMLQQNLDATVAADKKLAELVEQRSVQ